MTLIEEIQAKCSAELVASREHGAIADAVSVGRTKVIFRLGGIGLVLETLGAMQGAEFLDALEETAKTVSAVKWALVLLHRNELNFGSPATRGMIDILQLGAAGELLKATAVVDDPVTVADVIDALGE